MSMKFCLGLFAAACLVGCACKCPDAKSAASSASCAKGAVPAGRWTGDWESYPLKNPSFVRSGSLDLVIAQGGKMEGQSVEEDKLDRGSLSGNAKPGGEFDGEYVVSREGQSKRYQVKGSFVCDADGLAGRGVVNWGESERGSLKFRVRPAP